MDDARQWTLVATSAAHARDRAEHPAIICQGRRIDYAQLHRMSNRAAHALRSAGVGHGARVAWLGRESEYYYTIVLACAKVGAVLVPVNWRLTAREADHILRDSGAQLLFFDGEFDSVVEPVQPTLPALRTLVRIDRGDDVGGGLHAWSADAPDTDIDTVVDPEDAVVQIYTSGTTGLPKGAVVPHRSFFTFPAAMRAAGVDWVDWLPEDVNLISLPGLGTAGTAWFWQGFNAGLTNVVMRAFVAQEAVRLIRTLGVTTTFAAPAMLRMMLDERDASPEAFVSMRKVAYGGEPISTNLLTRSLEVFRCEFVQIYGSTETASVPVCLPPADHRPGSPLLRSAGRVCPGNELRILDDAGRELPTGEIGQICIRTPSRMLGYWNRPDATARTLRDGWLYMGDNGYLDEDGYLYVCDRIDDTIIVAGQNIYPAEIEKELAEHPAVAESAVVGLGDARWGEAVHACVAFRPDRRATPRELMLFLRGRIADYKIPSAYHVLPALPRNPAGKILRRVVRERLESARSVPDTDTAGHGPATTAEAMEGTSR
ncbi:long-chain-fatty-acid--CoA ligase [Embleya scabrispora]|uniref:long-chain-fatty-acid--CoA ligase n=1 Tax=Embleya scabrispora TaxID=159449 RepID=UPI000376C99D|nr:long-chain-fatty-acid--CoA ligase [Embleya scabrispora]MYS81513.1 long-chain-fatty-acid--CoA ligase [Streptomyces sp. SID5474]